MVDYSSRTPVKLSSVVNAQRVSAGFARVGPEIVVVSLTMTAGATWGVAGCLVGFSVDWGAAGKG